MRTLRFVPLFLVLLSGCEYFFDFVPPKITIISPKNGETVYGPVVFEVRVEDKYLAEVQVYGNGDTLGRYVESQIVDTFSLAVGSWTIEIKAWDRGGNRSEKKIRLKIESLIPLLTSPGDRDTLTDPTPTFSWQSVKGAIGYEIQVDDNADFSSPVIDTFISGTSFTPSMSLTDGVYYWRVRGKNEKGAWGTWTEMRMFAINTTGTPVLVSPSNGDTLTDNTPTFDWNNVSDAVEYQIQVDNNSDFSSPVIDTCLTASTYTPSGSLEDGVYYWRVRARNSVGFWGKWSGAWNFTIITQGPPPPSLVSPSNGDTLTDNTPSFDWTDVSGAVEYEIQVDNNSDFSSPEIDEIVSTSGYVSSISLSDGVYYWKVRGENEAGIWGDWSSTWQFTIITPPKSAPVLLSPSDSAWVWNKNAQFFWTNVSNATQYEIQFDDNEYFRSPEVDSVLSDTQFAWTGNVGKFFWRVRAGNYAGWGPWSEVREVEIGPYEVGYYDTPSLAWDVFVLGNYAYVADCEAGLRIIDISTPSSPFEVGYYDTPWYAWGVFVSGDYAYVADHGGGLRIIDISNPYSPQEIGDTPVGANDVFVSGNYAYVADWAAGLRVIDISNPSSPYEVGSYYTPGYACGVFVSGNYAYVADGDSGLRVIDISNPSSPQEVGSYDTPGCAWDVFVSGNYAYVADEYAGLRVIDISNPSSPYEAGYYDTPDTVYGVFASGNYAYVADEEAGLRIIDISNPSSPYEVGYYDTPGWAIGVFLSGNYAYVADYDAGLRIIKISP